MSTDNSQSNEPMASAVAQGTVPAIEGLQTYQRQLLRGVLRAIAIVGIVAVAAGTLSAIEVGAWWTLPLYWGAYLFVVALALWPKAPYALGAWAIIIMLYLLGISDFFLDGKAGAARAFMLITPFVAGIFFGRRESIFVLILSTATMAGFGVAYTTKLLVIPNDPNADNALAWISATATLFLLGTLMVVSLDYLVSRLTTALAQSRELAQELEGERAGLAEQVEERTASLERRSNQLEAAAQVAQEAASIQDVDLLLKETVRLISNQFGVYHAGIFLLDESGEYAELRAASSAGGQRMLARGHRLRVGQVGIVGYVTHTGEARIALDVGADATFFDNPDLPDTHSELALPLRARGEVIGALDVQSTKAEAFTGEDAAVLQTLADQVGLAISNARLFQQAQESLEAERRAYGQASREAWRAMIGRQTSLQQRYDPQGILPAGDNWREEMVRAAQEGQAVQGQNENAGTLAIPLKVRDQVVGVLDAHRPGGTREWTPEAVTLMQDLVDQLGVALEGARLYQDSQRRAARERLVGEVAARMRESLEMETLLRTAAAEMRRALDLDDLVVRLAAPGTGDDRARDMAPIRVEEGTDDVHQD